MLALALLLPAAANAQKAYIANSGDNTVSVIDTVTDTVTATVPLGAAPSGFVAVSPDGTKVYVANRTGGVLVIDAASNAVTGEITVGPDQTNAVAFTPDGTKAYVASYNNSVASWVSVINTATNKVIGPTIPVYLPISIAVAPDGAKAYVGTNGGGGVWVIDTATNIVTTTIPVGGGFAHVAVSPDGTRVYVANQSGGVSVIDTTTNTVTASIPDDGIGGMSGGRNGVAFTPDGTKAYVTAYARGSGGNGGSAVLVIDTANNTIITTIPVDSSPSGVGVTLDGTRAYVPDSQRNTVSVIATATNTVIATIPVGKNPLAFGKFIGGPLSGSPPVAANITKTTNANTPVAVDLTQGASRNPTSAALVGTPVGGTVSGFPATTVTFTPTTGFTGTASFQFTLANAFGTSNTANATITVTPGSAPSISSVSPNPVTGSNSPQPFTINGANFVTGANITLRDLTAAQTFPNRVASSFSSTQIVINPTFTTAAHSWSVEVINPGGQSSGQFPFQVIAPAGLPPIAKSQTVPITAGMPVPINLALGATRGKATSAAIVSAPAHGTITGIPKTKVTYTPTSCSLEPDSFTFTLSNDFGTSNIAMVTITPSAVTSPAIEVHLVDPFLLKKLINNFDASNIDLTLLYRIQKWDLVRADGLLADNTSAAIAVIKTNDCTNDVRLTTTNGTTLIPYRPDFLKDSAEDPMGGTSFPITAGDLLKNPVGGSFFAAALVQAPAVGATYSLAANTSAAPIIVTATQGSLQQEAVMGLVIPPVVLVHGIWGDRTALQFYENSLGTYNPWKNVYPSGFGIRSIQYTNDIAFDSPDATGGAATLRKTITGVWALLDKLHFAGGRVDAVAHSMGGLVARAFAGQELQELNDYPASRRDRRQGSIHQIVTLDTPEQGSELATFLLEHQSDTYQNQDGGEVQDVWRQLCTDNPKATVKACFKINHMNITNGAVDSLVPESKNIQKVPAPNEPKWIWNAIGAVVPQKHGIGENLLHRELEDLIAAIYRHKSEASTISQILKYPGQADDNGEDDAIVNLKSQVPEGEKKPAQAVTFHGFAHIPGVKPDKILQRLKTLLLDNGNVEQSQEIADLIACWLINNGAASCTPPPATTAPAMAQVPVLAPKPQVLPVSAKATNAEAAFQMPRNLLLASPFELGIAKSGTELTGLTVTQQDEMGHLAKEQTPAVSRMAGNTTYVKVIPMLLGSVTFTIDAVFKDGSASSQDVTVSVGPPYAAPKLFRGDQFPEFSLSLQKGGDVAPLQPEAYYATIPDKKDKRGHSHPVAVDLSGRVEYQIVPTGATPVVQLEKDSHGSVIGVKALRPGTATIEAHFGNAVDHIDVTVERRH